MSASQQHNEAKVFHFIADPGHKENLSGRVQAACVTCRRKKIKCTGTSPCSTCIERGVPCEGLVARRRPRRQMPRARGEDSQPSLAYDGTSATATSVESPMFDAGSEAYSQLTSRSERPTEQLLKLQQIGHDSGYASGSSQTTLQARRLQNAKDRDSSRRPQKTARTGSLPSLEWNWAPRLDCTQYASLDVPNTIPHSDLITRAEQLESQARDLRAFHAVAQSLPQIACNARRQTVALPLHTGQHGRHPVASSSGPLRIDASGHMPMLSNNQSDNYGASQVPLGNASWWSPITDDGFLDDDCLAPEQSFVSAQRLAAQSDFTEADQAFRDAQQQARMCNADQAGISMPDPSDSAWPQQSYWPFSDAG